MLFHCLKKQKNKNKKTKTKQNNASNQQINGSKLTRVLDSTHLI